MINVEIFSLVGWQWAKRLALRTVGLKPKNSEPSSDWKVRSLMAEHSHIKVVQYCIDIDNLRQWVGVHLLRHPFVLPYISTQRGDKTNDVEEVLSIIKEDIINDPGFDKNNWRDYRLQGSTNDHSFVVNAQTLINISRKRLCSQSSRETRAVWEMVRQKIAEQDAEMASVMVPNCIYRGFCPEMNCCGYVNTPTYKQRLQAYREKKVVF